MINILPPSNNDLLFSSDNTCNNSEVIPLYLKKLSKLSYRELVVGWYFTTIDQNNAFQSEGRPQGEESYKNAIAHNVQSYNWDIDDVIHNIKMRFEEQSVPDSSLSFIKDNNRICNYVFWCLHGVTASIPVAQGNYSEPGEKQFVKLFSSVMDIDNYDQDINTRFSQIVFMLDSWNQTNSFKKEQLDQTLKNYDSIDDYSWFENNHADTKWLYNYTKEKLTHIQVPTVPIFDHFLAATELFDCWQTDKISKRLFINQMKAAYKRRVNRRKNTERKFTLTFDSETTEMFQDLASWKGESNSKIISDLIRKTYKEEKQNR